MVVDTRKKIYTDDGSRPRASVARPQRKAAHCAFCKKKLSPYVRPVHLRACRHGFCRACLVWCMSDIIERQVKTGRYGKLKCWVQECGQDVDRATIEKLLPKKMVEKLDAGLAKARKANPRQSTGRPVGRPPGSKKTCKSVASSARTTLALVSFALSACVGVGLGLWSSGHLTGFDVEPLKVLAHQALAEVEALGWWPMEYN